MYKMLFFK